MKLIYGHDAALIPWIEQRLGHKLREDAKAIGVMRDGRLVAVIAYDTFSLCDCNMHVASDDSGRWLDRSVLLHAFAYPFIQLRLRRVTALVPASNHKALKLDRHLGFVDEGYHPRSMPNDDTVTLGMLREHCRWIPKEYRDE
jgi:RimJ/RimL family protein N-acetyltransferase